MGCGSLSRGDFVRPQQSDIPPLKAQLEYLEQKCPEIYVHHELLQDLISEEVELSKDRVERRPLEGNVLCGFETNNGSQVLFGAHDPNKTTITTYMTSVSPPGGNSEVLFTPTSKNITAPTGCKQLLLSSHSGISSHPQMPPDSPVIRSLFLLFFFSSADQRILASRELKSLTLYGVEDDACVSFSQSISFEREIFHAQFSPYIAEEIVAFGENGQAYQIVLDGRTDAVISAPKAASNQTNSLWFGGDFAATPRSLFLADGFGVVHKDFRVSLFLLFVLCFFSLTTRLPGIPFRKNFPNPIWEPVFGSYHWNQDNPKK